jgi:hypothetical protein
MEKRPNADYLKNRIPEEIKQLPNWAGKGIDTPLLHSLYEQLHCPPCEFDDRRP